jgi:hypothetical protein
MPIFLIPIAAVGYKLWDNHQKKTAQQQQQEQDGHGDATTENTATHDTPDAAAAADPNTLHQREDATVVMNQPSSILGQDHHDHDDVHNIDSPLSSSSSSSLLIDPLPSLESSSSSSLNASLEEVDDEDVVGAPSAAADGPFSVFRSMIAIVFDDSNASIGHGRRRPDVAPNNFPNIKISYK